MKTSPSSSLWVVVSKIFLIIMEKAVSKYVSVLFVLLALCVLPGLASAQGKIAVVNLEQAMLQTDEAQRRIAALREQADYASDKAELDKLAEERDKMVEEARKELPVMNEEQRQTAGKRIANMNSDLEHVMGKLQKSEQEVGQALLQEMTPLVQAVLRDLIQSEGIGLLLQRNEQQGIVIHADTTYSITAKVTDKLNQLSAAQ